MRSAGFRLLAIATAVAFLAGVWATERLTAPGEDKDPSEIVIDEVVGHVDRALAAFGRALACGG